MQNLIREIHRRSIWQVLGIYLAASWGSLEFVDFLTDNFGLPEWFPALAMALLVIGLPVVLATAFVQEGVGGRGRPEGEGSRGDEGADRGVEGAAEGLFTWRNAILGGVGALALWGVVAAGWLVLGGGRTGEEGGSGEGSLRSIAVLPFLGVQTDEESTAFAVGLHDDLLTQLAKIDSLTVISRTSVMQYSGTTKSIPDIARELGVATVLEGGVRRSGDRIRMNVQLIEAASDRHLWAETYDEELTAANLFAIQSDLARKIAGALRARLTPAVEERIEARPTESLEAYDIAMRARYAYETRASFGEDIDEVLSLFDQAIALDSTFAVAWVGRGNTILAALNWGRRGPEEAIAPAGEAIERALALDPDLAEAHLAEARLLGFQGRLEEAEASTARALELNPGLAEAHVARARVYEGMGRYEEAIAESRRAIELDPRTVALRNSLGDRLFFSGRFEESIVESRKAVEMAPGDWYAWYNMGWAHAALGRTAQSVEAFQRSLGFTTENGPSIRLGIAYAYAKGGQRDSAVVYIEGLDTNSYDLALVRWEMGDRELALSMLESSFRGDPSQRLRFERDPTSESMRADPRYSELLRRLGLE